MHRQESKHLIPNTLNETGAFGKLINELWAIGVIIGFKDDLLTIIVDEHEYNNSVNIIKRYEGVDTDEQ